jgi:hypothetical protein
MDKRDRQTKDGRREKFHENFFAAFFSFQRIIQQSPLGIVVDEN